MQEFSSFVDRIREAVSSHLHNLVMVDADLKSGIYVRFKEDEIVNACKGSKGIRQGPIIFCTSTIIHKIITSAD